MVSVCLPSDAFLQCLPSYLYFSYLGYGVSLHGWSSKAQPLLFTLDEAYLLTATPPYLECGIAPLGPPAPVQPPHLGRGVAPPGHRSLLWTQGSSSQPFMHRHCLALSAAAPDLGRGVAPLGHTECREEIPYAQGKRNPSKMVGVARRHQRAGTLTNHIHRKLVNLITLGPQPC